MSPQYSRILHSTPEDTIQTASAEALTCFLNIHSAKVRKQASPKHEIFSDEIGSLAEIGAQ